MPLAAPEAFVHRLQQASFVWLVRRALRRLRRQEGEGASRLVSVLQAAIDTPEAHEVRWFGRIETLRKELLQNGKAVSFQDFGVPEWQRGGEEVLDEEGKNVTRTLADIARSSVPPHEARLLFHLIRGFRPMRCLELGTCLGISGAYQAAALAINGAGILTTLEGGEALAQEAQAHFSRLQLSNIEVVPGRFQDTLPTVLTPQTSFDYAFIDGHHDPTAMLRYFEQLLPFLTHQAVLVFDDILWMTPMRAAWQTILLSPAIRHAVDLGTFGICFVERKP